MPTRCHPTASSRAAAMNDCQRASHLQYAEWHAGASQKATYHRRRRRSEYSLLISIGRVSRRRRCIQGPHQCRECEAAVSQGIDTKLLSRNHSRRCPRSHVLISGTRTSANFVPFSDFVSVIDNPNVLHSYTAIDAFEGLLLIDSIFFASYLLLYAIPP